MYLRVKFNYESNHTRAYLTCYKRFLRPRKISRRRCISLSRYFTEYSYNYFELILNLFEPIIEQKSHSQIFCESAMNDYECAFSIGIFNAMFNFFNIQWRQKQFSDPSRFILCRFCSE